MLRGLLPAAAGALCVLAAAPGWASPCTDQIDALERRLNETATSAASASSGGQAVAAARDRDVEALWALTEAHLTTHGPAGARVRPHTLRTYRLGLRRWVQSEVIEQALTEHLARSHPTF